MIQPTKTKTQLTRWKSWIHQKSTAKNTPNDCSEKPRVKKSSYASKDFVLAIDHCSVSRVAEVLASFYLLWNYCPRLHLSPYTKNAKIPPSPNKLGFIFREPELVRQMGRNGATEAEFCPNLLIIPVTNALPPSLTLKPTECNELSSKKRLGSHSSLSYSRAGRFSAPGSPRMAWSIKHV